VSPTNSISRHTLKMLNNKQEEFNVLKEYIKKLLAQNDLLKKENEALKRVIQNFHTNNTNNN
jgi:N-acetylglutamate synthase-like GNAT family acetyltransferase